MHGIRPYPQFATEIIALNFKALAAIGYIVSDLVPGRPAPPAVLAVVYRVFLTKSAV